MVIHRLNESQIQVGGPPDVACCARKHDAQLATREGETSYFAKVCANQPPSQRWRCPFS